jgi:hypothetical protein
MNYTKSTHPDWEYESDLYYFGWVGTYPELCKQTDTLLIHIESGEVMEGFTAIPISVQCPGWYLADESSMVADVVAIKRLTGDDSYTPCVPFIEAWEACDFRHSMVIYRIDDGKVKVDTVDRYSWHTDGYSIGVRR